MPRGRTAWAAAPLAATALLTGGCAQPHEAATLPPVGSPAATPTTALPALGPADLPVPAKARQKTPAGVRAFTDYYVELLNQQRTQLDPAPIRALSRACDVCTQMADGIDRARINGHHYDGAVLTVRSTGNALVDGDEAEIAVLLEQSPLTVRDDAGAVVPSMTAPLKRFGGGLAMTWDESAGTWLVTQFVADEVP